jgi:hypothetical protein
MEDILIKLQSIFLKSQSQKKQCESIQMMGKEPSCLDFQSSLLIKPHNKTQERAAPLLEIVRCTCFSSFTDEVLQPVIMVSFFLVLHLMKSSPNEI